MDDASQNGLPTQYLTEGRVGLADVEQTLSAARALEVEYAADLVDRYAEIDAKRQEVASRERSALAEAEKRRREFDAEVNKLFARVTARRRALEAQESQGESTVQAFLKERVRTLETALESERAVPQGEGWKNARVSTLPR